MNQIPEYETPRHYVSIREDILFKLLQKYLVLDRNTRENLLTDLEPYVDYSLIDRPLKRYNRKVKSVDKPRLVYGLFYLPKEQIYKYYLLRLDKSTIKQAGFGIYALETIPKGARGEYRGVNRGEKYGKSTYSWSIKDYDNDTGEVVDDESELYLLDAFDKKTSNWARYVNCGTRDKDNNIEVEQYFDKIFYITKKKIEPNTELFVDYGEEYREEHLGMKGKY